jgi:hypothetical protein
MKTASVVLATLFAATALPAAASVTARSDAAARSTIVQDGVSGSAQPRKICRRQDTTGARTGGQRICLTKEQWRVVNNGGTITTFEKRVR